jgi:hypothetical protein
MMMKSSFFFSLPIFNVCFFSRKKIVLPFRLETAPTLPKKMFYFFLKKSSGRCASNIWVRLSLISNRGVVVVTIFFSFFPCAIYKVTFDRTIQTQYNKKKIIFFYFLFTFWMFAAVCGGWTSCVVLLLSLFKFPDSSRFFFSPLGLEFQPLWKSEKVL